MTDDQRGLIDELAKCISRLCHRVIARRLEQFFEVIGTEVSTDMAIQHRLMDALNQAPDESLEEWAARARSTRDLIRKSPAPSGTGLSTEVE